MPSRNLWFKAPFRATIGDRSRASRESAESRRFPFLADSIGGALTVRLHSRALLSLCITLAACGPPHHRLWNASPHGTLALAHSRGGAARRALARGSMATRVPPPRSKRAPSRARECTASPVLGHASARLGARCGMRGVLLALYPSRGRSRTGTHKLLVLPQTSLTCGQRQS